MLKQSLSLVPARRDLYQAKLIFYLFLASLGMFFIASLITYCLIRVEAFQPNQVFDPVTRTYIESTMVYEPLAIPMSFWISTALLLLVSVFLQRAVWLVRRERQAEFRRWLIWAWLAAVVFVFVQTFGMQDLLTNHFRQSDGSTKVFGMSFALSFIHALHVLGGMCYLAYIIYGAMQHRYDHERHWAVDHCASYWHFLDVVWFSMLIMFMVTK